MPSPGTITIILEFNLSEQNQEHMLDVARGDVGLSRHLQKSLQVIRDKTSDKEFKKLADDVAAGKQSLREASKSEVFSRVLNSHAEKAFNEYSDMSEDEREELARVGERDLAALGAETQAGAAQNQGSEEFEEIDYSETTWLH